MWTRGGARIAEAEATRFRARRKELGLGPLVIHDNYLINLASPNPVLRTRSVQAFHQELVRAIALGADYLVAHPGSGRESSPAAAVSAIAQGLRQAARGLETRRLEDPAGKYCRAGHFHRLAIRRAPRYYGRNCPDLPLGICIDTAHTFASGWDIRTAEGLDTDAAGH